MHILRHKKTFNSFQAQHFGQEADGNTNTSLKDKNESPILSKQEKEWNS